MAIHKKQHDFASNSDHIFTGLTNNEIIRLNSTGTAVESAGVTTSSFLHISGGTVTGQTIFAAGLSATTLSGGTILSGSTNLYSIFQSIGSDTNHTNIQNGLNTYTGGTAALPTVNISGGSFNSITASGSSTFLGGLSANTLSGGTILSGNTNLYSIFLTAANVSASTVSAGSNISVNNVGLDYNVSVVGSPSFNGLSVSGTGNFTGALQSGGTDLYNIFLTQNDGNDITRVGNGDRKSVV